MQTFSVSCKKIGSRQLALYHLYRVPGSVNYQQKDAGKFLLFTEDQGATLTFV